MRQHNENGIAVARYLQKQPGVKKVFYPGLEDHPQYELAKQQQSGSGSMISIETGSLENANSFAKALKLCLFAESLGGVETLVCHPASMTHAALGKEGRFKLGITDGLIRISVGIEDAADIIADLDQSLSFMSTASLRFLLLRMGAR